MKRFFYKVPHAFEVPLHHIIKHSLFLAIVIVIAPVIVKMPLESPPIQYQVLGIEHLAKEEARGTDRLAVVKPELVGQRSINLDLIYSKTKDPYK